jgi:O-antigen ligase
LVESQQLQSNPVVRKSSPTGKAYFWLCAFYVVYCARPEDWIPGLKYFPLAKITAILALWGLFASLGRTQRKMKDLPLESKYLLAIIILMFVSAVFSPIWVGGAISHTLDFAKVYVAWALTFILVTTFERLKRIVFIQAASVAMVGLISILKGHNLPRLSGALGGMYSNPNDLAFCIVLSLPFCLAFMLSTKNKLAKVLWFTGITFMLTALLLTASRAGFIDLAIAGSVALWHFGIRGRRFYLIAGVIVIGSGLMMVAGGKMKERLISLETGVSSEENVDGSYTARKYLIRQAIHGIMQYPVFGVGVNNFMTYSGNWHEPHISYLQIGVEGGIPVMILYILFFKRGFRNLRRLRKMKNLDRDGKLFVGALHASLVGFVVGALFAPVAYQFFAYFAVGYTSTMLRNIEDQKQNEAGGDLPPKRPLHYLEVYAEHPGAGAVVPVR